MTKSKKTFNLFAISEARNVIFGIATLWIGLFHSSNLTLARYTDNRFITAAFRLLRGRGNVGVDMFVFLSGIGLFFSFSKDSNVRSFLKKRMTRVLPTAFLIATIIVSLRYINGRFATGLTTYISRITFTYFFWKGERTFWFISFILLMYFLFPVFYKIIDRFKGIGTVVLIAATVVFTFALRGIAPSVYSNIEIALCRIPVFIIGIWAGRFVMAKKEISKNWLIVAFVVAVGLLLVLYKYNDIIKLLVANYSPKADETKYIFIYRYISCPLSIALVMATSYVCVALRSRGWCNVLRNFFEFVGKYSMEYYLIYLNVNYYFERNYHVTGKHQIMMYFGSFIISIVLCMLSRKICDEFIAEMKKKPKQMASPPKNE